MTESDAQEIFKMSQRLYRLRLYSELSTEDKILFSDKPIAYDEWAGHVSDCFQKIEDILKNNKSLNKVEPWSF